MILQILTSYGIAYIITESFLLESLRSYIANKNRYMGNLLYCSTCMSFWIGLILTGNILEAFAIMGTIAIINNLK